MNNTMLSTTEEKNNLSNSAWICRLGQNTNVRDYFLEIINKTYNVCPINENDGMIIIDNNNKPILFARIFRKRLNSQATILYFDGIMPIPLSKSLEDIGLIEVNTSDNYCRLEWSIFENALQSACAITYDKFPIISGKSSHEQAYIRDLLKLATIDDLLGPANGPFEEIVGMSVKDRYLVGKLAPKDTLLSEEQNEELPSTDGTADAESDSREADASSNRSLIPSSFGLTVCIDGSLEQIEVEAHWGRYERGESETIFNESSEKGRRAWKRIPSGGKCSLELKEGELKPIIIDSRCPSVFLQGTVREKRKNGDRLITLFLVNGQDIPKDNQDSAWVFQPEIILKDKNNKAIFRKKSVLELGGIDPERESLEMIYRRKVEFAVGHGVSVHAITDCSSSEIATEVRTVVIPQHESPITETPGLNSEDRPAQRKMLELGFLDMKELALMEPTKLLEALSVLTDDYQSWIADLKHQVGKDLVGYDQSANDVIARCEEVLARLNDSLSVLSNNNIALEAFRFANRAMALQRVRSIYALKQRRDEITDFESLDTKNNRSWRPFQLAFMLMSIPALADPKHKDRTESLEAFADLLWFPTGGGKTEAYLGVAAFTMAIRRLQGNLGGYDSTRGLVVIMRYTLRLLTLQQFQRATTLICAMEVIRRENVSKWGDTPFTIGLWVGQKVTPNTTEESLLAIKKERDNRRSGSTPAQLTNCPWCGSEIFPGRDIFVIKELGKTIIYCGDKYNQCEFGSGKSGNLGLPVVVVDEEIYRRPPSMLIATVDKFAMMAWRGQIKTLFGRVSNECDRHGLLWQDAECKGVHQRKGSFPATNIKSISPIRPPDLIIQDEFHLISGPLGTMVGLYETAIDELSSWTLDDKTVRPKVIASTATVRKAVEQVKNVFLRRVLIFPPHGFDIEDNFFSVQRSVSDNPGRQYIGICAPGSSRPAVLIRLYVALLTAAQSLYNRFGDVADPYMTLVGYFNSLRELGGMRRLAEDDVSTRSYRVQMSDVSRPGLSQRSVRNVDELTSRVSSREIPKKLDQLEVKYKKQWQKGETRSIDIVLATNMLSVGVDVNRLGLMVVNGQPKSTAEYIQATSRVGRSFPGLVCTVLTWTRPRDLSHYESFEHYHSTFYKHVEAQSVTPFAPRAMDRGLTGAMVSSFRLNFDEFTPNLGAENMDISTKDEVEKVKSIFKNRAWKVTDRKSIGEFAASMISDRIDRWVREATRTGRHLTYETSREHDNATALLKKPGVLAWDVFTAPMSMREVEPGVRLIMDLHKINETPPWKVKIQNDKNDETEGDL